MKRIKLKIRVVSDIHNEMIIESKFTDHLNYVLLPLKTDVNSVLIIAGDFCNFARPWSYTSLLDVISLRFKDVIIISGNHEYYRFDYLDSNIDFLNYIKSKSNIHYLNA